MVIQDLSLIYTISHSENSKKFPIENKDLQDLFCRLNGGKFLFYFYSNSKIITVQQSFRGFLTKMYSEQHFLPPITSLRGKPSEFVNFIHIHK